MSQNIRIGEKVLKFVLIEIVLIDHQILTKTIYMYIAKINNYLH